MEAKPSQGQTQANSVENSASLVVSEPKDAQDVAQFVQTLLQQVQDKFQMMSDQILNRIDEMGHRIDDLEHNLNELMQQAGVGDDNQQGSAPSGSVAGSAETK